MVHDLKVIKQIVNECLECDDHSKLIAFLDKKAVLHAAPDVLFFYDLEREVEKEFAERQCQPKMLEYFEVDNFTGRVREVVLIP